MRPRSLLRDLLLLTALCWATYLPGLTSRGLWNWQEAQRAVVAREMQDRDQWLVPTYNGRPYLVKPPLIYWFQLEIASWTSARTGEFQLRLTAAMAGWLGVIATYLVARRLVAPGATETAGLRDTEDTCGPAWAEHAAWWAALFLATGILYVRSSRTGEIDILLVAPTVVAIGLIARAWRSHLDQGRMDIPAAAGAALAATVAVFAKGPPALLTIGLAAYGGIALWALCSREAASPGDGLRTRLLACWLSYTRTHPVGVLALGAAVFWLWLRAAHARAGAAAVFVTAAEEADDNLRLFVASAPVRYLGALSYGAGLGSLAALAAVVWLLRDRPPVRRGWFIVIAWVGLGVLAFSLLTKGVPRYLTPVWPGVAILGGMWFASLLRDTRRRVRLARAAGAAVLLLAGAQGLWYGWLADRYQGDRSPREFIQELLAPPAAVDPSRLATFEFRTPALDYYAGQYIEPVGETGMRDSMTGSTAMTLEQVAERARDAREGGVVLLVRWSGRTADGRLDPAPAAQRLTAAGMHIERIPLHARFAIDGGRSEVAAVRVTAGPG
jgi:4-amino-4-deoxy-L-arabinose transferase-like glycosyltransferase